MSNKDNGILQEHIREQLDNRKKPLKREKQDFSMIAVLGGVLFLVTLLVTLLMQLGRFFYDFFWMEEVSRTDEP